MRQGGRGGGGAGGYSPGHDYDAQMPGEGYGMRGE